MKRFLLVMLMLGLITAFSTTAFAADVKFSGQFYVAGMYVDQTSLMKDATGYPSLFTISACEFRQNLLFHRR